MIANLGILMPTPVCFQFDWTIVPSNAVSLILLNDSGGEITGRWRNAPANGLYLGTVFESLDLVVRKASDYKTGHRLCLEMSGEQMSKLGPLLRYLVSAPAPFELSPDVTDRGRFANNFAPGVNVLQRDTAGRALWFRILGQSNKARQESLLK